MDRFYQDHSGIVLGASVLVFIEVFPCNNDRDASMALSSPFVKLHLQEFALTASSLNDGPCSFSSPSCIGIQWNHRTNDKNDGDNATFANANDSANNSTSIHGNRLRSGYLFLRQTTNEEMEGHSSEATVGSQEEKEPPLIHLPSQSPLDTEPIPCRIVGYAIDNNALLRGENNTDSQSTADPAVITDGTLVRIMPPIHQHQRSSSLSCMQHNYLNELVGEAESSPVSEEMEEELNNNHNPETIQELTLRMSLQLDHTIYIGTTADALAIKRQQDRRRQSVANCIRSYCNTRTKYQHETANVPNHHHDTPSNTSNTTVAPAMPSILMREGALLVHCPQHGKGKTTLVQMIAQRRLKCTRVHVIQPGPLLAKYGSQADTALESILHAIVVSAAVQSTQNHSSTTNTSSSCCNGSICIILDHFDAMMPPQCSATSSAGDAAAPVLNAIAAYLKLLVLSLKRNRQFLFPSKNPLYNIGGRAGQVLAVKVCLVAVVTCPDDGWRSAQSSDSIVGRSATCILDVLPLGTYRLPASSAETRRRAFEFAFQKERLVLTEEAQKRLPLLAASAVWCRGKMFRSVAKRARQVMAFQRDNANEPAANQKEENSLMNEIEIGVEQIENALFAIGKGASAQSDISFLASESEQKDKSPSKDSDAFFFVGGNADAKRSLEDALALDPNKRAQLNSIGVGTPIGVLLYGPPGCGKTLLAKAVARLLKAPGAAKSHIGGAFVSLNSSDIVQSTVGSSEKLIVSTFQTARENAPSVIFIDEFQALFTERSSSGTGKLTSTLLQCMDDIRLWRDSTRKTAHDKDPRQSSEKASAFTDFNDCVLVLGATNTPWMVDKAFLRPGRFDRLVHVGLPCEKDRESILQVHVSKMRVKDDKEIQDICRNLAQGTHGFSGADLAALCRAAAVRCLLECCECIEERHFWKELNGGFVASSSPSLVQRNETWRP